MPRPNNAALCPHQAILARVPRAAEAAAAAVAAAEAVRHLPLLSLIASVESQARAQLRLL